MKLEPESKEKQRGIRKKGDLAAATAGLG